MSITKVTVKYIGPEVDDGTMPVENLLQALQGFSNAYGKIIKHKSIQEHYQLRLVGLEKGSCDILINVVDTAHQINSISNQLISATTLSGGLVISIIKIMLNLIKLTKHTQNKSYEVRVNGDNNNITIQNYNNVSLDVPLEVYEMYKNKLIASDLNRIAEPLREGQINETKLIVKEESRLIEENISSNEKEYFDIQNVDVTTTKETWLEGIINSLTKSTNNGRFILNNGDNVPFHLSMENPNDYYHFFSSKGFVKIKCVAHLDNSLKPIRLEVFDIIESQMELFKK